MAQSAGAVTGPKPVTTGPTPFQRYSNLTLELAIAQFKLRYTGSALGYLWSLFKPGMQFAIMYVLFVLLFKIKDNTPYFGIQLLLGIVVWTFFSECAAASMAAIAGTGHLIRKAYFPRSILVIAASFTTLFTLAINLVLVILIATVMGQIDFGVRILAVIPLLVELYAVALGISLLLSALFVQFRDIGHLWDVVSQILYFGSAILFSLTYLKGAAAHKEWAFNLVAANPIAQIVEDLRHAIVTPQAPWTVNMVSGAVAWIPFVIVLVVLVIGALVFRNRAPSFAENL